MAAARSVNANLMGTPGLEAGLEFRDRISIDCHARKVGRGSAPGDRRNRRELVLGNHPLDEDRVTTIDIMHTEDFGQHPICIRGSCEHQDAAGLEVQAMNDKDLTAELGSQQLGEILPIALRRRCGQEPRRLVDDDDVVVMMQDRMGRQVTLITSPRLSADCVGRALECTAEMNLDLLPRTHEASCYFHSRSIDEDATNINEHTRLTSREPGNPRGEHLIEAKTFVATFDDEANVLDPAHGLTASAATRHHGIWRITYFACG